MTDNDWRDCLRRMDVHEQHIRDWEAVAPDPAAQRCVHSRHRTLAHLRACQETWLDGCLAFDQTSAPRLKLLHPWRLFEQQSYELIPWEQHLTVFLADRARWKQLLQ